MLDDLVKLSKKPIHKDEVLNNTHSTLVPHELDDDYVKKLKGKRVHWGYHLLIDIGGCNKNIDDEKQVQAFIKELVKTLKMKCLGPTQIVKLDEEDNKGVSATQIISFSTLTFHGDNFHWAAYIDIFSCKPFDSEKAIKVINKYFEPKYLGKFFLFRDSSKWQKK